MFPPLWGGPMYFEFLEMAFKLGRKRSQAGMGLLPAVLPLGKGLKIRVKCGYIESS